MPAIGAPNKLHAMLGAPGNKYRSLGQGAVLAALLVLVSPCPANPTGTPPAGPAASPAPSSSPAAPATKKSAPVSSANPAKTTAAPVKPARIRAAVPPKPPALRKLSAEQYIAELEAASAAMLRMEPHPPRPLGNLLQPLTTPVRVIRSDRVSMVCNGDEWSAIISNQNLGPTGAVATRDVVQSTRAQVETSLAEVKDWNTPEGGRFYQAAGAGKLVTALEASGQIRTGPDWLQQVVNRVLKAISDAWYAFAKWLQSFFPSRPVGTPRLNLSWVPAMLWTFLIGLIACLVAMLWVSLGGRWDRVRRRRAEGLEPAGADAELMLLPPDELHRRALEFAEQGNFREALRHRYLSLFLVLDACGVWRYDTRRTNWEHIGKLRSQPSRAPLIGPLADITRRFDRVRYGGAACAAEDWERFYSDTGRLETSAGAPARASVNPAPATPREVTA